jgi:hypothetical protein
VNLEGYRQTFYTYSGKASDLNRQLGFAGIAIIWLFKKDTGGTLSLPPEVILPGIFIVASLALDMLQYVVGSIIWRIFYRCKEKAGVGEKADLSHSPWLEGAITSLFAFKIVCLLIAYYLIFKFLIQVFFGHAA